MLCLSAVQSIQPAASIIRWKNKFTIVDRTCLNNSFDFGIFLILNDYVNKVPHRNNRTIMRRSTSSYLLTSDLISVGTKVMVYLRAASLVCNRVEAMVGLSFYHFDFVGLNGGFAED